MEKNINEYRYEADLTIRYVYAKNIVEAAKIIEKCGFNYWKDLELSKINPSFIRM